MNWLVTLLGLAVLTLTCRAAASAQPVEPVPSFLRPISAAWMSRPEALAMASAALGKCEELGQPATVSIVDAEGSLRVTLTSDGAKIVGIETSMTKIAAVLEFRAPSAALQRRLETDPEFAGRYGGDKRFLFFPGALPIEKDGRFVGAIGVGGARPNDEVCALAGLHALSGAGE